MTPDKPSGLPYRPCVGIVLTNREGLVFAGERIDTPDAWQMPQGGIDEGETPREAALRELQEETGVSADLVNIEAEMPDWVIYDLPNYLVGTVWSGRYRGQRQRWLLMRFHGIDNQIDINKEHAEFRRWQWMLPDDLTDTIVPFKRPIYEQVLECFRDAILNGGRH